MTAERATTPAVVFRPYFYELTDGVGPDDYRYGVWLCLSLSAERSVLVRCVAAGSALRDVSRLKPHGYHVIGRGDPDPDYLVEVWVPGDAEDRS